MNPPRSITARDNPLLKELRKLGSDSVAYRKLGRIWVEGEHLCSAAMARGLQARIAVFSDAGWERAAPNLRAAAPDTVRVSDALFGSVSALDSPSDMGFVMDLPLAAQLRPGDEVRFKPVTLAEALAALEHQEAAIAVAREAVR